MSILQGAGALCFGLVVGWVLRLVLFHAKVISVGSMGTIIGAVGGAAVTGLFDRGGDLFAMYSIGLASGFFVHVLLSDIDDTGAVRYGKRAK